MKMKGFNHIGVNAGNFQETLKFYRDILCLKEENTVPCDGFNITYLRLPDGGLLELFDYGERGGSAQDDNSVVGYRHFAFLVEDVDAWHEKLKENGIAIKMAPLEMPDLGIKGMLCLDPGGTEVELCEPL